MSLSKSEGAGKTGCSLHPRSRVPIAQTKIHTSIQVQRKHSGLPCARQCSGGKTLVKSTTRATCVHRCVAICCRQIFSTTYALEGSLMRPKFARCLVAVRSEERTGGPRYESEPERHTRSSGFSLSISALASAVAARWRLAARVRSTACDVRRGYPSRTRPTSVRPRNIPPHCRSYHRRRDEG